MDFDDVKCMVEEFFNGQYEVKKFLGEGSFARVYLVKHNFLDDLRAMKIVKQPLSSQKNTKSVFQEVMLATHLRGENIINIYDAGIISDVDNYAYFVMEYVPGGDLEQYLNSFIDSNLFMSVNRVLDLIKQILKGLNLLHTAKPPIIHRDLKLNNILLSYNSAGDIVIKISDFGFAKEVTTSIQDIEIAGTRPYMAPECFKRNISTMSDIYAVGVIFYQLLTNWYPYDFTGFTDEELLEMVPWNSEIVPPSRYNEHISKKLDEIVLKCLDKNPENRYKNASELLADVEMITGEYNSEDNFEEISDDYGDDYGEYIINDSIKKAFMLAKKENRLSDAIVILESEILNDYDIRQCYGETLRMWKSDYPEVKLISKAFTVNLSGKNYQLSCNLVNEAFAYNPSIKSEYEAYIDLWKIFIELSKNRNLIKAVIDLENLMDSSSLIHDIYVDIISVLKTFSVGEIVNEALRLANMNNLKDASNLMEFAVVRDVKARLKYSYKMSLWKQNMKLDYNIDQGSKMNTVDYAIDLGTTDSVISYYNDGNPVIIKNHSTGKDFTPSAVLIDKNDNICVGEIARNSLVDDNKNAVTEFKNNMGFAISFTFENSSRRLLPEELSAEILKDLRLSIYNQCNMDIDNAVVCVPANSNPMKIKAVNDACRLAGFKSHSLILEPVAVAMAYDFASSENDSLWMIYDMGGGTFNVSLILNNKGEIEKIASSGLENSGGNLIDWKIIDDVIVPKIAEDMNLSDFRKNNLKYSRIFSKLKIVCENAKMELSELNETEIFIPNLFEGYDFRYCLNRLELERIIEPILRPTFDISWKLLNDSNIPVDRIVLVGGSCLSPVVQDMVKNEFNVSLEYSINPLTAVAQGASVYAGNIERKSVKSNLDEVSLMLNPTDCGFEGKIFSMDDDNYLFLGFFLEVSDFNTSKSVCKIPINPDGTFEIDINGGHYRFSIYHENKLMELDEFSPDSVIGSKIHIPLFDKKFSKTDINGTDLADEYCRLISKINYIADYENLTEENLLEYLKRIINEDIGEFQTNIFLKYLAKITDDKKREIDFSLLLANVESKLKVINKDYDIAEIIEKMDYEGLLQVYGELITDYVKSHKHDVIEQCFTNLRYEGIFSLNSEYALELIEKGMSCYNSYDYECLLDIVNELYSLDERNI